VRVLDLNLGLDHQVIVQVQDHHPQAVMVQEVLMLALKPVHMLAPMRDQGLDLVAMENEG